MSVHLNLVTGPFEKKAFAFPFFFSLEKCRSLLHLQGKEGGGMQRSETQKSQPFFAFSL